MVQKYKRTQKVYFFVINCAFLHSKTQFLLSENVCATDSCAVAPFRNSEKSQDERTRKKEAGERSKEERIRKKEPGGRNQDKGARIKEPGEKRKETKFENVRTQEARHQAPDKS